MDQAKFNRFAPLAHGAYGNAAGAPLQVGSHAPVFTTGFRQANRPPPGFAAASATFQATAYEDRATGRYVVAFAGIGGSVRTSPDGSLVAQGLPAYGWHLEMDDAILFTCAVFRHVRAVLRDEGCSAPALDQLRARVEVTGHCLGGALAELVAKFYGIGGYNLDGPGVSGVVGSGNWRSLKAKIQQTFPDLQAAYALGRGQFSSDSFSVVGMAGRHLADARAWADPQARADFHRDVAAAGARGTALSLRAVLVGAAVAGGAVAAAHHLSRLIQSAEHAVGLPQSAGGAAGLLLPLDEYACEPFAQYWAAHPNSAIAQATALQGLAHKQSANVAAGLSPFGLALDGGPTRRGLAVRRAFRDPARANRIVEMLLPPASSGGADPASPLIREFVVDKAGKVGRVDAVTGKATFVHSSGAVVSLVEVGATSIQVCGINSRSDAQAHLAGVLSGAGVLAGVESVPELLGVVFGPAEELDQAMPVYEPDVQVNLESMLHTQQLLAKQHDAGLLDSTFYQDFTAWVSDQLLCESIRSLVNGSAAGAGPERGPAAGLHGGRATPAPAAPFVADNLWRVEPVDDWAGGMRHLAKHSVE